jgi:hypothetical protein
VAETRGTAPGPFGWNSIEQSTNGIQLLDYTIGWLRIEIVRRVVI